MIRNYRWLLGAGTVGAGLAALLLVPGQLSQSADHFDPPLRTDLRPEIDPTPDRLADIADVFAFYDETNVYLAVTVHTRDATIASPLTDIYDPNVLYGLNISTGRLASDAEVAIRFRFGTPVNGTGYGVKFENLPGLNGSELICPVEALNCQRAVQGGTVRAYAGLRDDPFFFDLQGFRDTVRTGNLAFQRRDFFAGKNILSVVLQIPRASLNADRIGVWATSARFGGQL
jgi:hypothetical protein